MPRTHTNAPWQIETLMWRSDGGLWAQDVNGTTIGAADIQNVDTERDPSYNWVLNNKDKELRAPVEGEKQPMVGVRDVRGKLMLRRAWDGAVEELSSHTRVVHDGDGPNQFPHQDLRRLVQACEGGAGYPRNQSLQGWYFCSDSCCPSMYKRAASDSEVVAVYADGGTHAVDKQCEQQRLEGIDFDALWRELEDKDSVQIIGAQSDGLCLMYAVSEALRSVGELRLSMQIATHTWKPFLETMQSVDKFLRAHSRYALAWESVSFSGPPTAMLEAYKKVWTYGRGMYVCLAGPHAFVVDAAKRLIFDGDTCLKLSQTAAFLDGLVGSRVLLVGSG